MKKFLHTLTLFLLVTGLSYAQSAKKAAKAAKQQAKTTEVQEVQDVNGPQMVFEALVMDYGEIEKGSDPLRKFHFTNLGTEPLVIKQAKGSCGCTVPDYPKEPIMPGESSTIDVRYDTNRVGPFTKTVSLTTNMGEEKVVLTIKGKVDMPPKEESVPAKEKSIF